MCCIFTCCGWMIDLIQRVWVFIMSCCIATAVCCVLITTSMSGVALGYNYSLAEYIDLKETNVSVYIKRGVFDDDVVDDMIDFRRRGNDMSQPVEELRAPSDNIGPEEMPPHSGRRLDNVIVESNDNSNFEGSLMKLTLTPPHSTTVNTLAPDDAAMAMSSYPPDSLDQLKAIQGIINARKALAARKPADKDSSTYSHGNLDAYFPGTPPVGPEEYRRMLSVLTGRGYERPELAPSGRRSDQGPPLPELHPARFAVPSIISQENWVAPKMSPEMYRKAFNVDSPYEMPPEMPKPVTYRAGPIRPTNTRREHQRLSTFPARVAQEKFPIADKSPLDQQKLMEAEIGRKGIEDKSSSDDEEKNAFLNKIPGPKVTGQDNNEYYDDELKGLPVRRRRSLNYKSNKQLSKIESVIPQKVNPGLLTKFKVGKSISNEITDFPSILVSKLHFLNNSLANETTSTNEKEVGSSSRTIQVTENDIQPSETTIS